MIMAVSGIDKQNMPLGSAQQNTIRAGTAQTMELQHWSFIKCPGSRGIDNGQQHPD